MTEKRYISYSENTDLTCSLIRQVRESNFNPDYIVGLSRGGLLPATIMSHGLDLYMMPLEWSTRDYKDKNVSHCGLAEDIAHDKRILVVDDINDSGETLITLKEELMSLDNRLTDEKWKNNVKVAVLIEKSDSEYDSDFYCDYVLSGSQEDIWVVFPWENV